MSRPFSYNDENFTVIGNLLVIHIKDNEARGAFEPVLKIPPSIYDRILTNSFTFLVQLVGDWQHAGTNSGTTVKDGNEHFIAYVNSRAKSDVDRYYIGFTLLKDI